MTFGGGAGHQAVAAVNDARRTLRSHILSALEDNDAQGRVEPKVRLAHRRSERKAELLELAQGLRGRLAAAIADRFEGSETGLDPLLFGGEYRLAGESSQKARARSRRLSTGC